MSVTFPTGHAHPQTRLGSPTPAKHCRCEHGARHEDTCVFCGRYERETIRDTWSKRARVLARGR